MNSYVQIFQFTNWFSYLWEACAASCCSFSLYCPLPRGAKACVMGIEKGWVYFLNQQTASKISCHDSRICEPNSEQKKGGTRLQPLWMCLRKKTSVDMFSACAYKFNIFSRQSWTMSQNSCYGHSESFIPAATWCDPLYSKLMGQAEEDIDGSSQDRYEEVQFIRGIGPNRREWRNRIHVTVPI